MPGLQLWVGLGVRVLTPGSLSDKGNEGARDSGSSSDSPHANTSLFSALLLFSFKIMEKDGGGGDGSGLWGGVFF